MVLAPAPTISVYDCAQTTTLPGTPAAKPGNSTDATAKRAFDITTALAKIYSDVFQRNSIDDGGMTLLCSVHYAEDSVPSALKAAVVDTLN